MTLSLADRLDEARHRQFVGRESEVEFLRAILAKPDWPFLVLYIFGPGGVGKTSLLREFAYLARQTHIQTTYVDMRDTQPSPQAFIDALGAAMRLPPATSPLEKLAVHTERHIIFIDTYEALASLGGWLRRIFLPQLSERILITIAGRDTSSLTWRSEPGWRELVQAVALRNFSLAESEEFLLGRGLPTTQYQAIFDFTHGHPLALSLIADEFAQHGQVMSHFNPGIAPDVIKTLLDRFVTKVPSPTHRVALEACAQVRLMTEPLLATMLAVPEASDVFEWLRGLSFVEAGPRGVFLHDLAGKTLAVDLRWRNPELYKALLRRARAYYTAHLPNTDIEEQQRIIVDYIYLHRQNPVVQPFVTDTNLASALVDNGREQDWPLLTEMVARHEGQASAQLAAHWFVEQPQGVVVIRNLQMAAGAPPLGFLLILALEQLDPATRAADPATLAAWSYLREHTPLRAGERASLFRFWLAHDTYQNLSPIQALLGVNMVRHFLTSPNLAFTFFPCAEPDFWAPLCAYANLKRIPAADFEVAGRRYGVFGHDWRATPPLKWLDLMAERETMLTPQPPPPTPAIETVVVLSRSEFEKATRQALHDFQHSEALRTNPLLRSRLILEPTGGPFPERVARLQQLLKDAAKKLESSPRQLKFYRALYHTYFNPAPSQEKAAELLDLPFSTFRRHLKSGINELTNFLWQQEIGDFDP